MIDASAVEYRLLVMTSKGKQYDLRDYITDLGWEEPENEVASRLTFTVANDKLKTQTLAHFLQLGMLCKIQARAGSKQKYQSVASGYVTSWTNAHSSSGDLVSIRAYDKLYNLQQSEDYFYFTNGTSSKTRFQRISSKWGISLNYKVSSVSLGKMAYKNESLSSILKDVLDRTERKINKPILIIGSGGKLNVIYYGTNMDANTYILTSRAIISINYQRSTEGMVTQVVVYSQDSKDDKRKNALATVKGNTKFGIRQKIVVKSKDDSLKEAKADAKKEIKKNGQIITNITVKAVDIPFVHKGDRTIIQAGGLKGDYYVLGVSHDCYSGTMTLNLESKERMLKEV